MSEPPTTTTTTTPPLPPPTTATYPPTAIITSSYNKNQHQNIINTTPTIVREYRKGNWTLEETLILITAKKLDDERRINNNNNTSASTGSTGELRWKWVENYCWSNGCLRSQNQCNDKWDNLLRDYKKVREYQNQNQNQTVSYWSMDKTQRKQRNLPSNMLLNIYQALNDVVQRKHHNRHSFHQNNQQQLPSVAVVPPPAQLLPEVPPPPPSVEASAESSETQGDYESEKVNTETKRRKMRRDIGSSILHSTTLLSQTLKHYDEKKEKQHRELMELEHKRLQLEESRNQVNHQGFASLITSINKLSDAIHALISDKGT